MENTPQELPHLVVGDSQRSPWAIGGIVVLSLMVLAIPVGLFLVQQKTSLTPEAAVIETDKEEGANAVVLESKLSPRSKSEVIHVDVYIKSSSDAINLVEVKLKFDPSSLAVEKIATDAGSLKENQYFNKWLEVNSDNNAGIITITAGVPSPGVTTADLPFGKAYLATVNLRPLKPGRTVVQAKSDSLFLRNSDNQNIFQIGHDLVLNLSAPVNGPPGQNNRTAQTSAGQPVIVITNPKVATNYSFFKPIDIIWSAFSAETISQINLYVSGAFFTPIAQNLEAKSGKFTWKPQDSLPLPYIQPANTFMIEVVGIGKNGESSGAITGPFGILGTEEVKGSPPSDEVFSVNPLTIDDASRLLSNYLVSPLADKSLDFNKDEVINDLDFYLLRQNLAGRGVIR